MIGPRHEEKEDAQVVALNQEIGRRLRAKRIALGLTQADVADAAGVAKPRIVDVEHGRHDTRISSLIRLAKVLRMDAAELLRDI